MSKISVLTAAFASKAQEVEAKTVEVEERREEVVDLEHEIDEVSKGLAHEEAEADMYAKRSIALDGLVESLSGQLVTSGAKLNLTDTEVMNESLARSEARKLALIAGRAS